MALFRRPLPKPDVSLLISSGFPVPNLLRGDGHHCFGCCHCGYLSALAVKAPAALRHVNGFPVLGLLRPLRRHGPRGPKAIPCPHKLNVTARRRSPVRPLERPRWSSLGRGSFGRRELNRPILPTAPLHAVARDVSFHRWRLGFKQFILNHIARVLRGDGSGMFARTSALPSCSCPLRLSPLGKTVDPEAFLPASPVSDRDSTRRFPRRTLSHHPARATGRRLPPSAGNWSSSCRQLAHSQRR
jgi:hypothetical protein